MIEIVYFVFKIINLTVKLIQFVFFKLFKKIIFTYYKIKILFVVYI
jgi:hypothetical protein